MDALDRGVEVNIFTNSKESIDTPSISGPILCQPSPLLNFGANIYLKQEAGATLHSKFMTVDGSFHEAPSTSTPAAYATEPEMTVNILDAEKTRQLEAVFLRIFPRLREYGQLRTEASHSKLLDMVNEYFFNQL